jgi:transcriptional regulator with XRE-family HTH domain
VYYTLHTVKLGPYVRHVREALLDASGRPLSLRTVAQKIGIEPTYLSKIEREELPPPSEAVIVKLAAELGEDPDVLLAMGGRVSSDLLAIIRAHPKTFAAHLRALRQLPEEQIALMTTQVRDGQW